MVLAKIKSTSKPSRPPSEDERPLMFHPPSPEFTARELKFRRFHGNTLEQNAAKMRDVKVYVMRFHDKQQRVCAVSVDKATADLDPSDYPMEHGKYLLKIRVEGSLLAQGLCRLYLETERSWFFRAEVQIGNRIDVPRVKWKSMPTTSVGMAPG